MTLRLYFHPLSSFCQKVLIALYENGTPFEGEIVDLMDPAAHAAYRAIWPIGKFPLLRDEAADRMVPESSIIIEYLDRHFAGRTRFLPEDPDLARQVRFRDRFLDSYLNLPMQKVVADRLRPQGMSDAHGVAEARDLIERALGLVEQDLSHGGDWIMGDDFCMADCAAAPSLFYVDKVRPLSPDLPRTAACLGRLKARPSYARALAEAEPYFKLFPGG